MKSLDMQATEFLKKHEKKKLKGHQIKALENQKKRRNQDAMASYHRAPGCFESAK